MAASLGKHLAVSVVQRVGAADHLVQRVAVCPGAGGSLLRDLDHVDAVVTGEMRHHDQLALMERGVGALLAGHTETERGYLPRLAGHLSASLPACNVVISTADRSPISHKITTKE